MASYSIKKTSNGEFKEINKKLKLNISKYVGDTSTLYFDVEGQDTPFLMEHALFFNVILEQIQKGLIENLTYNNGTISLTMRDGNTIKNYSFDFNFDGFNNSLHSSHEDLLRRAIYKIVTLYKENPNSSVSSEQKYMLLIYDIIDGDRIPIINDQDELLRIFEIYNCHKYEFLDSLMENVVFFDDDGYELEYSGKLKDKKLSLIRYDVYNQMEAAILLFASENNAIELYQKYLDEIYIPRREITYTYENEEGEEVEVAPEIEGGTIFSLGRELIEERLNNLKERASHSLKRILRKENV